MYTRNVPTTELLKGILGATKYRRKVVETESYLKLYPVQLKKSTYTVSVSTTG